MPFATPFAFCKIYLTGNAKLPASYWHCHWQNNWQNNWQMPHKITVPAILRLATARCPSIPHKQHAAMQQAYYIKPLRPLTFCNIHLANKLANKHARKHQAPSSRPGKIPAPVPLFHRELPPIQDPVSPTRYTWHYVTSTHIITPPPAAMAAPIYTHNTQGEVTPRHASPGTINNNAGHHTRHRYNSNSHPTQRQIIR